MAVPAFMRVDPATISGPDQRRDGDIHGARQFRIGRAADPDGTAPSRRASATAPSTYGVRPLAAIPTSTSRGRKPRAQQVARADRGIVFGGFGGAAQRRLAAGDDALHQVRRNAECGRAFGGVQHSEAAAGSRADVEQPPALLHGGHDCVHGARDRGDFLGDGLGDLLIFGIDDARISPVGMASIDSEAGLGCSVSRFSSME